MTNRSSPGDLLGAIGDTRLIELRRVVPAGHARVLVKLESENPTGSMKDRMALAVVDEAAASGRLRQGGRLVEYTGGSTGTSLAFVCAARSFDITLVTSDAFSREKRDHMRALGADVIELPSEDGRITKALVEAMMDRAAEISASPGAFYADQFNNEDAIGGYASLGREIAEQTGGEIDAFVQTVGTSWKSSMVPSFLIPGVTLPLFLPLLVTVRGLPATMFLASIVNVVLPLSLLTLVLMNLLTLFPYFSRSLAICSALISGRASV